MTVRPSRGAAITASVLAIASLAWAQETPDAGAPPSVTVTGTAAHHVERRLALTPGTSVALRTGFVPDPLVVRGEVAPRVPLAPMGEGCLGLSTSGPTQRIRMDTRFGFLRIFATGAVDLTLAVQTPNGVICSDDRFGRHPSIEGRFAPGEIAIWVGVKADAGSPARAFELEITETRSIRPGVRRGEEGERLSLAIEAGLDVRPEHGTATDIRLRRGFLPDPRYLEGNVVGSTDSIDASGIGDVCRGFVPALPAHVVTLSDDLDFFQIYVAEAPESTTLVVVAPDGGVSCDAADGDHPNVTRPSWPAGAYRVWVGAQRLDGTFPYRLGLSEIRRVR